MAPGPTLRATLASFRPPKPDFTEKDVPDLQGKVCLVTGSNTGVGKEVARILYAKGAKVWVAARSEEKAKAAIEEIKISTPDSTGELVFLHLDLSDLNLVKKAAEDFLAREKNRLHILFNNAGVMVSTPEATKTVQGHELSLGVNCIGTLLFAKLLTPLLVDTAKSEPANTVRIVWLSSFGLELFAAKDLGVSLNNLDYHEPKPATERYGISKCGAWALGVEYARRHKADGIVSVPINPGNLTSELARDQPLALKALVKLVGYPPVMGAYTELFAAFSPQVTLDKSGEWGMRLISLFFPLIFLVKESNYLLC